MLTDNTDTLILQLGCILHSVQAWKKVYKLRVLVFVEYQEEVDSERGRVQALLEKLRIEAEVHVFWLASGDLATYDTIVSGQAVDPTTDSIVNECLREEEWWDELQTLRGRPKFMSAAQELDSLANVVESTAGRPGVFNPHNGQEEYRDRRRQSLARLAELPKKPTVSTLARLGVNMGIHTANLLPNVFDSSSESASGSNSESDSDTSDDDGAADFNDDASAASEGDLEYLEPVRRPLLSSPGRRKSYTDAQLREPVVRRKNVHVDRISRSPTVPDTTTYGTMSPSPAGPSEEFTPSIHYPPNLAAVSRALMDIERPASPRRGLSRNASRDNVTTGIDSPKPIRPGFSRQHSQAPRFSSQVIPETEIIDTEEGSGPVLGFADSEAPSAKPGLSRAESTVRFSSRLLHETRVYSEDSIGPTVSFAPEPETRPQTRPHTMPPSPGDTQPDVAINIPDLLASFKLNSTGDEGEGSSSNENPSLPLSFNDLPSRAQYLILNELWRQHSSDSAVLFTTLPIPAEGTCRSEEASIQYLSDIEVLCNDLPPVLLVLSNNMT